MTNLKNAKNDTLQKQRRLFSSFLSKRVPPIPTSNERRELPLYRTNIFSRIFFAWLIPMMNVGYKRTLEINDLWFLDERLSIETLIAKFNHYFLPNIAIKDEDRQIKIPMLVLINALFFTLHKPFLKSLFFTLLANVSDVMVPLLLRSFIRQVEARINDPTISMAKGSGYAIGITILLLSKAIFSNHLFLNSKLVGTQIRSLFTKLILEKSLILDSKAKNDYPNGKIFTLMSSDLSKIDMAMTYLPFLLVCPIPIAIGIALLIVNIGVSSLAGIGVFLGAIAILVIPAVYQMKLRSNASPFTDKRVGLIREVLNTIKMIKFYAWEDAYEKKISEARTKEVSFIFKTQMAINLMLSLIICLPNLTSMVAFLVLYAIKGKTNAADIFSSLALFNVLTNIVTNLPLWAAYGAAGSISMKRLRKFLEATVETELSDYYIEETKDPFSSDDNDNAISIKNGEFKWEVFGDNIDEINNAFNLHDINLDIKQNEFIVITGSIGSGKSSLLSAIDKKMKKINGSVSINGSHLVCGNPWIQSTTVRENILFGLEFDEIWYSQVIKACSLQNDFKQFTSGDLTEIGESGITLSGGQKARINLARAVYSNPDILLFDDVLSAVDANVGKHIIENCILTLIKDKTRVLATHQLGLVHSANRVIFLNGDGTIDVGTFDELSARNSKFQTLMESVSNLDDEDKREEKNELNRKETNLELSTVKGEDFDSEDKAVNSIPLHIYKEYFKAGEGIFGKFSYVLLIGSLLLAVFLDIFTNIWLSFWVEDRYKDLKDGTYIGLYILFVFLSLLFLFFEASMFGYMITQASKTLNMKSVYRLLHSPMKFIDTSPTGRILNRFTKDTNTLDNEIGEQVKFLIHLLAISIGILILCFVYSPWLILTLPGLLFLFVSSVSYYLASAREVKRLEAITRSLVYNNFNETLSGLDLIKSYKSQDRFLKKNDLLLDKLTEVYIITVVARRWITQTINLAVALLTLIITFTSLAKEFNINASSTGLIVSNFITLTDILTSALLAFSEVENEMNSVERVCEYAFDLEQEAPYHIEDTKPENNWPERGSIDFENISLRYREGLPLVLKNMNLKVEGSEKIGICGRTGAGKSSLIVALYRLSELSQGRILIDGVDISKIGLNDLRKQLSIIPQDPVLFEGTIRKNLDPFDEYTDEKLWDALRRSHLVSDNTSVNLGTDNITQEYDKFHLDGEVKNDGSNFSLGERQLIALARALVRNSKILIMDEATSSVDYNTDKLVQETIAKEFKDCTVLCIAHRLRTIIRYDKILVLEKGMLEEFGKPIELFKAGGIFTKMCGSSSITEDSFGFDDLL